MTGRKRRRIPAAITRTLVRVERAVVQAAMVPVIALADRRIGKTIDRS